MSELDDPAKNLWIALAQPESLERVVEIYQSIEALADAGGLQREKVGDLLAQAFSTMKNLAGDDPVRSRDLILRLLLPRCLADPSDRDGVMSTSRYREILGGWVESLSTSGDTQIRDEVVGVLRRALTSSELEAACWTLFEIGFRTDDVVAELWSIAEQEAGEVGDTSLATLVGLGEGLCDRERLLNAVHGRTQLRYSRSLLWAMRHLGDSTSLDVLDAAWLSELSSASWRTESFLLVRAISAIADANSNRPDVQDRAWEILSKLRQAEPERMASELALAGDLATLVDSPKVVPDLLEMLDANAGDSFREEHFRYLLYRRIRDCVRPRQLAGWLAPVAESTVAVIRSDATRDTKVVGMYRTLAMNLKRYAWDVLLSLGRADVLSTEMFEAAIATETSPFVQQRIIEWLACFRYREIPPTVARWVTEHRWITRETAAAELTFRTASTRLLQSTESREAFNILLRTGYSLGGAALLSSLVALSEVARALCVKEDRSIADELVTVLSSGSERHQRVAAAEALIELAAGRRLPDRLIESIWQCALDPDRDDSELSRSISILGSLPRSLLPGDFEARLSEWANGTGQCAQRAVETLARQGFLIDRPSRMEELVGLTLAGNRWILSENTFASDRNVYAIALLFEANPDRFEYAVSQILREKNWEVIAQVVHLLDQLREGGRALPGTFAGALVARIGERQTPYTTETELFDVLRRWSAGSLTRERWESLWDAWMPDARVALADALGRLDAPSSEERERAIAKLLLLVQDGIYAVRRAAYRALVNLSTKSLQAFCETSATSVSRELRRRGGEACGWIVKETDFGTAYHRFASDPEKAVREAAQRSRAERRSRRYAELSLAQIKAVELGTDTDMLGAWPYGRALVQTGDDDSSREIREHAALHVFHSHLMHWLTRIVDGLTERWREVTQKWPDPWYAWDGAIVRGTGKLISSSEEDVAVEYCIIKEPAKEPKGTHKWHGVAWATDSTLSLASGDREWDLILADGSKGRITIRTASFDRVLFTGSGAYPG